MSGKMHNFGLLFALAAALSNSSIAIISKFLIADTQPELIAFYKSVIAAAVLWCFTRSKQAGPHWSVAMMCAFFGVFCPFYFETAAYQLEKASHVVFVMMASAAMTAFVWDVVGKQEKLQTGKVVGLLLCLAGMSLLLDIGQPTQLLGVAFAAAAGMGYGTFVAVAKIMKLGCGLVVTRSLLTAGATYLLVPAAISGFHFPTRTGLFLLLLLALLPSIIGFYCTTKAIELTTPTRVQICELSEPVFVLVLSFFILGESPSTRNLEGGALILFGILIANFDFLGKRKGEAFTEEAVNY